MAVYGFIQIVNKYRMRKINYQEQFIMAYGGLRGAVGFSLVELIDKNLQVKNIFVTATLVITMFTIFIQVCVQDMQFLFSKNEEKSCSIVFNPIPTQKPLLKCLNHPYLHLKKNIFLHKISIDRSFREKVRVARRPDQIDAVISPLAGG